MTEKIVRKHQRSNAWEEAGLYWSFSEKAGLYWTKKKRGYFSRKSGAVTRINALRLAQAMTVQVQVVTPGWHGDTGSY